MNILVTGGNTRTPIDRVRCITNIFTGRTGAAIALHAHQCGHRVTLLTSHPEAVVEVRAGAQDLAERWMLRPFSTFDDLSQHMSALVKSGAFNVVVHCAAVSDYLSAGVYAPAPGTRFSAGNEGGLWQVDHGLPALIDRKAGKVKSDEPELWLRLKRAPKLIDLVRSEWAFRGLLVKFKLEVGVSDEHLLEIAESSRMHSAADLMVANTLEGSRNYAFIGPIDGHYERVSRGSLAPRLLEVVERQHR